jgi:hypothetical protein
MRIPIELLNSVDFRDCEQPLKTLPLSRHAFNSLCMHQLGIWKKILVDFDDNSSKGSTVKRHK